MGRSELRKAAYRLLRVSNFGLKRDALSLTDSPD